MALDGPECGRSSLRGWYLPALAGRYVPIPGRRLRQSGLARRCRGLSRHVSSVAAPGFARTFALWRRRGGHVWFFLDEAIPAALARRLGAYLLTETMEDRPDIGLDSYDRIFPNQDTLPQGGLGNHPALRAQLLRLAAFQNPEFCKAQAMRLSTYGKPRIVACAEDHPHHVGLPRGCLDEVRQGIVRPPHRALRTRRALRRGGI